MRLILNNELNPYFNLAAEEFLLDSFSDNTIMLWRNDRSVIIGRNQNAFAEINQEYTNKNQIPVVRRLSGGGAVFHDPGNINFSFFTPYSNELFNNYSYFTKPIIEFLAKLGIKNASLSGRNDILIDGHKVSGNAQAHHGKMLMHHGTLLFKSNMSELSDCLKPNPLKINSHGIKSVKSRVKNINDFLTLDISPEHFIKELFNFFCKETNCQQYSFNTTDKDKINLLVKHKYSLEEWNFGIKPQYSKEISKKFDFGLVELHCILQSDKIKKINFTGDYFSDSDISELENNLAGTVVNKEQLQKALCNIDVSKYISGFDSQKLIEMLLSL